MHSIKALLFLGLFCFVGQLQAQQTTIYTEANLSFKRGEEFFNKGIYRIILFSQTVAVAPTKVATSESLKSPSPVFDIHCFFTKLIHHIILSSQTLAAGPFCPHRLLLQAPPKSQFRGPSKVFHVFLM